MGVVPAGLVGRQADERPYYEFDGLARRIGRVALRTDVVDDYLRASHRVAAGANNLVMDTAAGGIKTTLQYTGGQLVTFVNRVK
jgi:hypothetical protein